MSKSIYSTLFVNNMSQAALFVMEISGQISDGKWENSRPYDHWKWVCHTDIKLSDKNCYTGGMHLKRYKVNTLFNEFMKYGEIWPMRMYYYAKFGTILEEKYINDLEEMRMHIEQIGFNENINTLEELKSSLKDYQLKYWKPEFDEVFSTENIMKFRKSEYSIKDMKNDLAKLHISINTNNYSLAA